MVFFRSKKGFKSLKIKKPKDELEPQEILLDRLAKEREAEFSERRLEVPLRRKVLQGFFFLALFLFFFLSLRTFCFQVLEGKELSLLAKNNKERIYPLKAKRGVIYDSSGKQLVFNKGTFDLICDKRDLPWERGQRDEILKRVSQIVEKDFKLLEEELESSLTPYALVAENLEHEDLVLLETEISSKKLKGFFIEENETRDYVEGELLSHILGFTGKITKEELETFKDYSVADIIGKRGIEKFYESLLRGKYGMLSIERDVQGNVISEEILSEPHAGKSLLLYLDFELQKKIEKELSQALKRSGTKKGVAVALNPQTGAVLALVSLPSFDSNLFSKRILEKDWEALKNDPERPLFNRAIGGIGYPTGSTIKPLIATAALEEKIIKPERMLNCQGVISVENPYFPQVGPKEYKYHDWKIHGITDMRKAIAESCNVYFYTVGGGYKGFEGLGPEKIIKWLSLFGWDDKTGIDLPEEGEGILPNIDSDWHLGDTYHLSIGQGAFSITPLQVATAFSAIANGGILYKPQVVKEVLDLNKNVVEKMESKIIRENFIKEENLKVVREGMRQAVTAPSGSAYSLNTLPVSSAAKTGTAQTAKEDVYHSWVTVFAPYEEPEIVITLMVEDVLGLQRVVLPVAKEVLNWYFSSP